MWGIRVGNSPLWEIPRGIRVGNSPLWGIPHVGNSCGEFRTVGNSALWNTPRSRNQIQMHLYGVVSFDPRLSHLPLQCFVSKHVWNLEDG